VATQFASRTGRGAPNVRALASGTPRWIVALQRSVRGVVSVPGMANYESARGGFNPSYAARPAAVVLCSTEHDVRMSLLAAQDAGVALRVRSGRHSLTGSSNVDGGLVIDIRQLKHIAIDHAARSATVGAGAILGEVNATLGDCMLHVPAGASSTIGIAGFMQGGGYCWTTRMYGMNCDRVAGVRVMLADGRIVRATREVNPSLLWALCGGAGGNFGVLLDATYDVADLYAVWGFVLQWPIDDAPEVLAALQDGFMRRSGEPGSWSCSACSRVIARPARRRSRRCGRSERAR
jgi:FAD/FMN-containing dehydrogenase